MASYITAHQYLFLWEEARVLLGVPSKPEPVDSAISHGISSLTILNYNYSCPCWRINSIYCLHPVNSALVTTICSHWRQNTAGMSTWWEAHLSSNCRIPSAVLSPVSVCCISLTIVFFSWAPSDVSQECQQAVLGEGMGCRGGCLRWALWTQVRTG